MTASTMKGVWISKPSSTHSGREFKDFPVPEVKAQEALIKNVAVASNPKDWKLPLWTEGHEMIEGNDVAGYVEKVGEGVTAFKVGDKVGAFTRMRDPRCGAYAEYSVSPVNSVFHLGPKTTFEDAAALPLAYMTAAIGLYRNLGLPTPDSPSKDSTPVLIWGASTTVGVYAVQLAKLSGLYVVGVAGAGVEHAKSYGADEVIDYRNKSSEAIAAEIQKAAGGKIQHAYDAVSENSTEKGIALGLQPQGGTVCHVLPLSDELSALPKNVKFVRTFVGSSHDPKSDGAMEFAQKWFAKVGEWMEEGKFRPQKVTIVPGGLQGVEEGLRRLEKKEVSGEKLVYIIADTPGLA